MTKEREGKLCKCWAVQCVAISTHRQLRIHTRHKKMDIFGFNNEQHFIEILRSKQNIKKIHNSFITLDLREGKYGYLFSEGFWLLFTNSLLLLGGIHLNLAC